MSKENNITPLLPDEAVYETGFNKINENFLNLNENKGELIKNLDVRLSVTGDEFFKVYTAENEEQSISISTLRSYLGSGGGNGSPDSNMILNDEENKELDEIKSTHVGKGIFFNIMNGNEHSSTFKRDNIFFYLKNQNKFFSCGGLNMSYSSTNSSNKEKYNNLFLRLYNLNGDVVKEKAYKVTSNNKELIFLSDNSNANIQGYTYDGNTISIIIVHKDAQIDQGNSQFIIIEFDIELEIVNYGFYMPQRAKGIQDLIIDFKKENGNYKIIHGETFITEVTLDASFKVVGNVKQYNKDLGTFDFKKHFKIQLNNDNQGKKENVILTYKKNNISEMLYIIYPDKEETYRINGESWGSYQRNVFYPELAHEYNKKLYIPYTSGVALGYLIYSFEKNEIENMFLIGDLANGNFNQTMNIGNSILPFYNHERNEIYFIYRRNSSINSNTSIFFSIMLYKIEDNKFYNYHITAKNSVPGIGNRMDLMVDKYKFINIDGHKQNKIFIKDNFIFIPFGILTSGYSSYKSGFCVINLMYLSSSVGNLIQLSGSDENYQLIKEEDRFIAIDKTNKQRWNEIPSNERDQVGKTFDLVAQKIDNNNYHLKFKAEEVVGTEAIQEQAKNKLTIVPKDTILFKDNTKILFDLSKK